MRQARDGPSDMTEMNNAKKNNFKRLIILESALLLLMLSAFTVGFLQDPKERYEMFIFSTLSVTFLFCQFYMTYYLGTKELIEYNSDIIKPSLGIALIFWKTINKTSKKIIFIVYVAALLGLILSGIVMFSTSTHH